MKRLPTMPSDVALAFRRHAVATRKRLMRLRTLIFDEAEHLDVGPITETPQRPEPAYLTAASHAPPTVRLGCHTTKPGCFAAFFHCQSTVVSDIRGQFGDTFTYQGNRGVFGRLDEPLDEQAWRACLAMALLYKVR